MIQAAGQKVLNSLFPKVCPFCGEILRGKREICTDCEKKLVYIGEPRCKKCGKPFDNREDQARIREYCGDCTGHVHAYQSGMPVFQYNEEIRESIYRFKYHNQRTYADFYGTAMAKRYGKLIKGFGIQVLVPVPVSREKRIKRGYNQTELIACKLGGQLDIPVEKNLLVRIRDTVPQKELNDTERRNNLKNAFKVSKNVVQYKKVLLVDDIYTTGSTIDACAETLKAAGVREVYFISIAIGEGI